MHIDQCCAEWLSLYIVWTCATMCVRFKLYSQQWADQAGPDCYILQSLIHPLSLSVSFSLSLSVSLSLCRCSDAYTVVSICSLILWFSRSAHLYFSFISWSASLSLFPRLSISLIVFAPFSPPFFPSLPSHLTFSLKASGGSDCTSKRRTPLHF